VTLRERFLFLILASVCWLGGVVDALLGYDNMAMLLFAACMWMCLHHSASIERMKRADVESQYARVLLAIERGEPIRIIRSDEGKTKALYN
jgi:hypothetical protein